MYPPLALKYMMHVPLGALAPFFFTAGCKECGGGTTSCPPPSASPPPSGADDKHRGSGKSMEIGHLDQGTSGNNSRAWLTRKSAILPLFVWKKASRSSFEVAKVLASTTRSIVPAVVAVV